MKTVLIIFFLSVQSSYSGNTEIAATEESFDTVQFYSANGANWRPDEVRSGGRAYLTPGMRPRPNTSSFQSPFSAATPVPGKSVNNPSTPSFM